MLEIQVYNVFIIFFVVSLKYDLGLSHNFDFVIVMTRKFDFVTFSVII